MFYIVAIVMTAIGIFTRDFNILAIAGLFAIAGAIEIHKK